MYLTRDQSSPWDNETYSASVCLHTRHLRCVIIRVVHHKHSVLSGPGSCQGQPDLCLYSKLQTRIRKYASMFACTHACMYVRMCTHTQLMVIELVMKMPEYVILYNLYPIISGKVDGKITRVKTPIVRLLYCVGWM